MKISEIRTVIRSASWVRHDLSGHTAEEFARRDVPAVLGEKIAALEALVIAPRFADDIAHRDREIGHCRKVIARWQERSTTTPAPLCNAGGTRHVFLGASHCTLCAAPYDWRR